MLRNCIILLLMAAAGCGVHDRQAVDVARPVRIPTPATPEMLTVTFLRWEKSRKPGSSAWEAVFVLKNASEQTAWFRGYDAVTPRISRELWTGEKWESEVNGNWCGTGVFFQRLKPGGTFEFSREPSLDELVTFRAVLHLCCFSDDESPAWEGVEFFDVHSTPAIVGTNLPKTVG